MKVTRVLIIVLVALLIAAPAGGGGSRKDPDSRGIFEVVVEIGGVEAGSGVFMGDPQGTSIREGPMTGFDLSSDISDCLFQEEEPRELDGFFAISVYVNKKTREITNFAANFYNFTVNGKSYTLWFGPEDVDVPDGNWLPSVGTSNTASGGTVRLTVNKGPQKNSPCPDVFDQAWTIDVTRTS